MDDDQEEAEDRSNLLEEIEKTIDVVHAIVYDVSNLCELYKEDKIRIFKVAMLKDFCRHFEISFKSKDKKKDLIEKIAAMVEKCTCA